MPKSNKNRNNIKPYDEATIQKALNDIKAGLPKKTVAKRYNIPRATLQFRLSSKFKKTELGRNTYLTKNEEEALVQWIIEGHRKGFPRRKLDVQQSVKAFMDASKRPNPFKDNLPGDHWYQLFLKRHKILTERTPEGVTAASANVSENNIRGWFKEIEEYFKEKNYMEIIKDASRVFNGDETCFRFCPKLGKVIAPVGTKNAYEIELGQAKQNLTVMFSFSAAGKIVPPLIIYPNKRLSKAVNDSVPENWGIALSDNGWMKSEIFFDYIKNIFHPFLVDNHIDLPVVLFVDGHKTHLTYELSKLCTELQIILVALYPNSTRILQPADVSNFRPLKYMWKKGVLMWRQKNPFCNLGKEQFAPILKETISHLKPETIVNGFKACGLHPWNPDAIDYEKCLGKQDFFNANNNPKDDKPVNHHESINFSQFCEIIGEETTNQLRHDVSRCTADSCNNFKVLKALYDILKPIENDLQNDSVVGQNRSVIQIEVSDVTSFTEEEFQDMPIIFEASANDDSRPLKLNEKIVILEDIRLDQGCGAIGVETNNLFLDKTCKNVNEFSEGAQQDKTQAELYDSVQICVMTNENKENINTTNDIENHVENQIVDNVSDCSDTTADNSKDKSKQEVMETKIEDYLTKLKTPQRKGRRQSERAPFVLTSTGFKKLAEEKEKLKDEQDRKKEENKQKRKRIKEEKERIKEESKQKKQKKLFNTNNVNKNKREERETRRKENGDEKKCVTDNLPSDSSGTSYMTNGTMPNVQIQDCVQTVQFKQTDSRPKCTKVDHHVRHLFKDTESKQSYMPNNNIPVSQGLCYSCTRNINFTNIGIKCQKCCRTYHVKCLEKQNKYENLFVCQTCKKKVI